MTIDLEQLETMKAIVTDALASRSPLQRKVYIKKTKEWMQCELKRFEQNPSARIWTHLELSMAYYQQSFWMESRLRMEANAIKSLGL